VLFFGLLAELLENTIRFEAKYYIQVRPMPENAPKISFVICISSLLIGALGFLTPSFSLAYGEMNTFGYTGGSDSNSSTFGGLYVSNYTSPSDLGNITQVSAFIATGGTSAKAVIYSDDNGKPNTLLAQSNQVSVSGTSGTWINFPIVYSGVSNTPYWLGILFLSSGTYFYATGKPGCVLCSAASSGPEPPESFSNATLYSGNEMRIYAAFSSQNTPPQSNPLKQFVENYLQWVVIIGLIIALLIVVAVLTSRSKHKKANRERNHHKTVVS
jgi:hypothetical protein